MNTVKHADYPQSRELSSNKIKIAVWPEGEWCSNNMLEDALLSKSNCYHTISVDAGLTEEEIDVMVMNLFSPIQSTTDPEMDW